MTKRVPEIRFEDFTDDWEQRSLGDLASVRTGKAFSSLDFSEDGEYLVVTNKNIQDEKNGISSDGDRINISDKTTLSNYLLKGNNVLVTMDGVNIGKTGKYTDGKAVLAQRVGRINSDQIEFIYQVTSNYKFQLEMNKLSVGNAIKHISLKQISDYTFSTPINDEEKERIGILFNDLDKIITLHQRKLEQLQSMKDGFLQKMFPKNGEKEPEIRFSGFTDDWEQRKLGEELSLLKDGTHGTHRDVVEGPYLLSAKNIKNGRINITEGDRKISKNDYKQIHKNFQLRAGDVLLTIVGSIGQTAILHNPVGITFQRSVAYLRAKNIDSIFLYTLLTGPDFQRELKNRQVVSAQPGIYLGDLAKILLSLPIENSEQQTIGLFFKQLDDTIALHQRELELLKQTKKAFLQKMFV